MAEISADGTEFRIGRTVARSFSTFFRNILPFGLIALVVTSPTYVYTILAGPSDSLRYGEIGMGIGYEDAAVFIVELLLTYLVTAALVYGTIQDLRNNKVSVGECFSQGLARMFPAMGVAVISIIVTAVAFLPVLLGAFFPLAGLILVIPGFMVVIMLWVTIPVAVIERRGLGSLGRSMELTKGYRWRIFFVALIMLVIIFVLSFLIGIVAALKMAGGSAEAGAMITGAIAVEWVVSALLSGFMAVVYAVSYHDLRVAKEGVDTDQIASVFD